MQLPQMLPPTEHGSEIGLLFGVAAVVGILCAIGLWRATTQHPFDPSAYLVVLTLIVGAITKRWDTRSIDRMGQNLAQSNPPKEGETS